MINKSIGVSEVTAQDLGKVAKKNKVSRDMVISKMLAFFQTYGIDPFNYEAPHEEMTKIIKRFDQMFAFLKKQEKDVFKRTLSRVATFDKQEEMDKLVNLVANNTESLLEELITDNKQLKIELKETKKQLQENRNEVKKEHEIIVGSIVHEMSNMFQTILEAKGKVVLGTCNNEELAKKMKQKYER